MPDKPPELPVDPRALEASASVNVITWEPTLLGFLDMLQQHGLMYLGNDYSVDSVYALSNGWVEADRSLGVATDTMERFQQWINARYQWSLGRPWPRVFSFENLWARDRALKAFFVDLDMFRRGEPPDALTPVAAALFETNPDLDLMTEEQKEAHKKDLRQIFWTG